MSDLGDRIRQLTDTPPTDFDKIVTATGPARHRPTRSPRRYLVVAAVSVAVALVAAVVVVSLRPSDTSTVTVQDDIGAAPSGPAVTRHTAYAGYRVMVTLPHSTYPAGSPATAMVSLRRPRPETVRKVCLNQVFRLQFESVSSVVQPSWSQAQCAGSVTIGRVDHFHVTATVPDRPGAYEAILRAQHVNAGESRPLPVTVVPADNPPPVAPITMALHLDTTRTPAGRGIHGAYTFDNHTGHTITVQACAGDGWLETGLTSPTGSTGFPLDLLGRCPPTIKLHPGLTREDVVVPTSYRASCDGRTLPECGTDGRFPSLPPGQYTTTTKLVGLPATTELPAPVTVTLLPRKARPTKVAPASADLTPPPAPSCPASATPPSPTLSVTLQTAPAGFSQPCYYAAADQPLTIVFTDGITDITTGQVVPLGLLISPASAPVKELLKSSPGAETGYSNNALSFSSPEATTPAPQTLEVPALAPGTYDLQLMPLPATIDATLVVQ